MKCPYCSEEMEIGVIPSRLELAWFKGVKTAIKSLSTILLKSQIIMKDKIPSTVKKASVWKSGAATIIE